MQPQKKKRNIWGNIRKSELNVSLRCMKSDAEVIDLTTSEMPLVCGGLCNVPLLEMALKYGALI